MTTPKPSPSAEAMKAANDFFDMWYRTPAPGESINIWLAQALDAFAARAVAEEREACAKMADHEVEAATLEGDSSYGAAASYLASAIRARGGAK